MVKTAKLVALGWQISATWVAGVALIPVSRPSRSYGLKTDIRLNRRSFGWHLVALFPVIPEMWKTQVLVINRRKCHTCHPATMRPKVIHRLAVTS